MGVDSSDIILLPSLFDPFIYFAEWDVFVGPRGGFDSGLLAQSDFPFARQILIELHPRYLAQTRKFFELMGKQGYVITHKEPNTRKIFSPLF